jgi:hypothetical protein
VGRLAAPHSSHGRALQNSVAPGLVRNFFSGQEEPRSSRGSAGRAHSGRGGRNASCSKQDSETSLPCSKNNGRAS